MSLVDTDIQEFEKVTRLLERCTVHNCIFALKLQVAKGASILSPVKLKLLLRLLQILYNGHNGKSLRGVVAVESHKHAAALVSHLKDCPTPVYHVTGHSDIINFNSHLRTILDTADAADGIQNSFVLIMSDNALLYAMCMGLFKVEQLDFLVFDHLSHANRRHPYCTVMEYFYAPLLLSMEREKLPRIIAFTSWPKTIVGEGLQVMVDRKAKLRQYHRTFFSPIIPLDFAVDPHHSTDGEFIAISEFYSEHEVMLKELLQDSIEGENATNYAGALVSRLGSFSQLKIPDRMANLLCDFYDSFDHIASLAYLSQEASSLHKRINTTGALIIPVLSTSLLLAVCSQFSRLNSSYVAIKVFPVKRINETFDQIYDKDRVFYKAIVSLPSICAEVAPEFFQNDTLDVSGPLASNRTWAINNATFSALCKLHQAGIIDDNLLPIEKIRPIKQDIANSLPQAEGNNILGTISKGTAVNTQDIQNPFESIVEIIPEALRLSDDWKTTQSEESFFLYRISYESKCREIPRDDPSKIDLPLDSLIHRHDLDFFSSHSGRTLGILLKQRIPADQLWSLKISAGSNFYVSAQLVYLDRCYFSEDEKKRLLEFQLFYFSIVNTRPIISHSNVDDDTGANNDFELEDGSFNQTLVPEDKKEAYLVTYLRTDQAKSSTIMGGLHQKYTEFVNSPRNSSQVASLPSSTKENRNDSWSIDWATIAQCLDQTQYIPANVFLSSLTNYSTEGLPPAPEFITSVEKPPVSVDLVLFALRRVILYAPHNGVFYRIKRLRNDLNPMSHFESKSFSVCNTFADYMRLRYGLETKDVTSPLLEVKRIEGFSDIFKWFNKNEVKKSGLQHRKKRFTVTIIPEFFQVLPFPYAFVRPSLVVPRVLTDLEKQLLALQFYKDHLPELRHSWPSMRHMAEALTGMSANLHYSYERMETIGDSILKLFTTIDVFIDGKGLSEGQLSAQRQEKICNYNLCLVANRLNIPYYTRLTAFDPRLIFPPDIGALLDKEWKSKWPMLSQIFDDGVLKWQTISDINLRSEQRHALRYLTPSGQIIEAGETAQDPVRAKFRLRGGYIPVVIRFGKPIPPKTLADLVESLIASMYFGPDKLEGAKKFMMQVGLLTEKMEDYHCFDPLSLDLKSSKTAESPNTTNLMVPIQADVVSNVPPYSPSEDEFPYAKVESILRYKFENPRLLFQACTHGSIDISYSYERLEWLGDAALDWIVIKYYYESFPDENWMTPDRITWARQTAVCNESFARLTVRLKLHNYLRISAPCLQVEIGRFVNAYLDEIASHERQFTEGGIHVAERSIEKPTVPPAPKTLGDLFEALAGAVFLDLKFKIDEFENVFLPLIKPYLEENANPYDLPDNPIQDLQHDLRVAGIREEVKYDYPVDEGDQETKCILRIGGRAMGIGEGPTRESARTLAMRRAIDYIRTKGWRELATFK